ncbi:PadR family transcriptional regulator [Bacillus sp. FJAT-49732]|uniref:PadR family transcriptional regulator n=1 Tax=Lederbergia citrisecunda TaxID=2833583 RepID=A0A942TKA0_9BACI|nr:PadR family transcriptional regulator [Lederbergia citrisecunda]MBS4199180.1 PadR family transcriptional regulator [Lederbergia citrisecunda]
MDHRSLLLLGLLMSDSQHGYQIHDFIEKNLPFISNMKKATAYSLLDKLSKEGFINVSVEFDGNRPPRKVYSINESGRNQFYQLLIKNVSSSESIFYEGDIGLMFLDHLPLHEAIESLQKKYQILNEKYNTIKQLSIQECSRGVKLAMNHKKRMLEADLSFINETIQQLSEYIHLETE